MCTSFNQRRFMAVDQMIRQTSKIPEGWTFRLFIVCFSAASVGLPIAWISLAKAILFCFSLFYICAGSIRGDLNPTLKRLWTTWSILLILGVFTFSQLWTAADSQVALLVLVKHGKLLEILLLISLIRTTREARIGVIAFILGQTFLLISSWSLAAGISIPWRTATNGDYVVFSSYLDQSIIFASSAAIFWHLRSFALWPKWIGILLALAALVNVLGLLGGRTGHLVALFMISLSFVGAVTKKYRLAAAVVTPLILLAALYLVSGQVQERLSMVIVESQRFESQGDIASSSGWRINAWHRSLQAINESPWIGHGVGSWTIVAKRIEGESAKATFGSSDVSNPHQEYLLWGVELGIGGALLLPLLIVSLIRDASRFEGEIGRSIYSVTGAMAVACLFNSALYDALLGDYFCVGIGLLMALGVRSEVKSGDSVQPIGCVKVVS